MKTSILISILMWISIMGWTQEKGMYGNLNWNLSNDTLFINGTGKMPDFIPNISRFGPPWFTQVHQEISSESIDSKIKKMRSKGLTFNVLVISEGVTNIGDMAFVNCDSLTSVIIPDGLERIGSMAFISCHKLASIVIPESLTEIGEEAFYDNINLKSVTIKANTPPTFRISIIYEKTIYPFDGEDNTLYVPKGKVSLYKKEGWDKFFKKIVEY